MDNFLPSFSSWTYIANAGVRRPQYNIKRSVHTSGRPPNPVLATTAGCSKCPVFAAALAPMVGDRIELYFVNWLRCQTGTCDLMIFYFDTYFDKQSKLAAHCYYRALFLPPFLQKATTLDIIGTG